MTLPPNFVVRPYRGVSVQTVPTLEPARLRTHLLGRRVYRRTEFLIAECDGERAVVRISREPGDAILVPVADVELIASGPEVRFIDAPDVDAGNASQLAAAAAASGAAGSGLRRPGAVPARQLHRRSATGHDRRLRGDPPGATEAAGDGASDGGDR